MVNSRNCTIFAEEFNVKSIFTIMEQKKNNQIPQLHEVVDINGSKVFVENGEVKSQLNENVKKEGMSIEDFRQYLYTIIDKEYELQ